MTAEEIRALRARLGLSQVRFAAIMGVSSPAVAQWETDVTVPHQYHEAVMLQMRQRLDESEDEHRREEFVGALATAAFGGALVLLGYLFAREEPE
jgi:transcriptional regulator with XRE-family HTH domain